jgi:hypothetical protein
VSPPPDPKANRFDAMARGLRVAALATAVLAVISTLTAGAVSSASGAAMAALLVAVPLLRVLWLAQRWIRRGDLRFGLIATAVLAVVATGALLA